MAAAFLQCTVRCRCHRSQHRVVEFQDLDGAFVSQLAQPQRVVGVELRQGARVLSRSCVLYDAPVARVQTLPQALVDAERYAGARLVEAGIIVVAGDGV
jgi:hypothetical protein